MTAGERYQMAQGVSRLGEEVASLWLDLAGLSHRVAQLQRLAMTLRQGLEAELAGRPAFDTSAMPSPAPVPPPRPQRPRLTRKLVLDTLATLGREAEDMAVSALLPALQAHDATITPSLLSPMLTATRRDGLMERSRHGHYRVATPRRRVPLVAPPAVGA